MPAACKESPLCMRPVCTKEEALVRELGINVRTETRNVFELEEALQCLS